MGLVGGIHVHTLRHFASTYQVKTYSSTAVQGNLLLSEQTSSGKFLPAVVWFPDLALVDGTWLAQQPTLTSRKVRTSRHQQRTELLPYLV